MGLRCLPQLAHEKVRVDAFEATCGCPNGWHCCLSWSEFLQCIPILMGLPVGPALSLMSRVYVGIS